MTITHQEKVFVEYLNQHDLIYSSTRRIILEEVFKIHGHFEIHKFLLYIKKKYKNISRATVYRTFQIFLDLGLIRKYVNPDGRTFYEHVYGHTHHDHMICTHCGKIIEIKDQRLNSFPRKTGNQNNRAFSLIFDLLPLIFSKTYKYLRNVLLSLCPDELIIFIPLLIPQKTF